MELEIRTHCIVAAQTGNMLPGPRIKYLVSHRMGKFPLCFVTGGTNSVLVGFHHGQFVGTMRSMAVAAFIDV